MQIADMSEEQQKQLKEALAELEKLVEARYAEELEQARKRLYEA